MNPLVFILGAALGVSFVLGLGILGQWIIWRLRGRPVCGFTPPMHLRNLRL